GLGTRRDAELAVQTADLRLDRVARDEELGGDLLERDVLRQVGQDDPLTTGQRSDRCGDRVRRGRSRADQLDGAHVLLQVLSGHVIPTWRVPVCCYKKRRTKVPFMTRVFTRGSGALQRARSGGVRYGIVAGQRRTPHENDRRRTASSGCPTRRLAPIV